MTLLAAALFVPEGVGVSLTGFAYNLIWVTVGSFIGGTLLVAELY